MMEGEGGCRGAVLCLCLRQNIADVDMHGTLADKQCRRNITIALPTDDEPEHFHFAL